MKKHPLVLLLFALTVLFQVLVISRWAFLYFVLRVLFLVLVAGVIYTVIKAPPRTRRLLLLGLAVVILIRLPFLLHPTGLITTSDNATDGLQCLEIRDTHTAPVFLLDAIKHMGTVKYMFGAMTMDFIGPSYLACLLVQLALFLATLFLLYEALREAFDKGALAWLLILNFAFVETAFDYSLSIRAGSQMEMLFYFALGAALFDFEFRDKGRLWLALYFLFFSIYLHPLSAVLVAAFLAVAALRAVAARRVPAAVAGTAGALVAGLWHWFVYLLFLPKPVSEGAWEKIPLRPLGQLSLRVLLNVWRPCWQAFSNLFRFEFSYLAGIQSQDLALRLAQPVSALALYAGLAAFAAATVLAAIRVVGWLRKRATLDARTTWALIHLVLLAAFVIKTLMVDPPLLEPRHNFDLLFLVILSVAAVAAAIAKAGRGLVWKAAAATVLLVIFTFPHYLTYLRNARHKAVSYAELMTVLEEEKVKALASDFIIIYPVYFLSGRRILVSDTIGPFWVRNFYPEMRRTVDSLPLERQAFVFYADDYPRRDWHVKATHVIKARLLERLEKAGFAARTRRMKDFVLILPVRKPRH